ncbi:hypothetical protein P7C70_g6353, partial [Phenoliferia sp. Uapishka_3]
MLSSLIGKLKGSQIDDAEPDPSSGNTGDAAPDSDEEDAQDDPEKAKRTYSIVLNNSSGLPIQITAWPVRATKISDYLLSTSRGSNFYNTVPQNGTFSLEQHFEIGELRGPKHLDPRPRWGWIFFDLVHADGKKVHLQVFVKVSRNGVQEAVLGRTDLDSSSDNPMPSGEVGKGAIKGNTITFSVDESLKDIENTVDDSTKEGIGRFTGKGIETSSYVSSELARASVVVGSAARYHDYAAPVKPSRLNTIRHTVHEIGGISERYIGCFVEHDGKGWWDGHVKVHPITGIAKGKGFDSTADTTAIFDNDSVINYGFHDAGKGRHDQVYVYATKDQGNWLGDLIQSNQAWRDVPFSKLALPAAHDCGMFGPLDAGLTLLIQQGQLGNALASHAEASMATPIVHFLVQVLEEIKLRPERVINNIALTQKDSFADQLHIGVRFFDFRPGFSFSDVIHTKKGVIHHQHAMVPGCTYLTFINEILNFLGSHPSEIVFVEIKSDGFLVHEDKLHNGEVVVYSMIPTESELAEVFQEARKATSDEGRRVEIGSAVDLDKSIGEIIDSRKRLVIVDRVHEPDAWNRADSYGSSLFLYPIVVARRLIGFLAKIMSRTTP